MMNKGVKLSLSSITQFGNNMPEHHASGFGRLSWNTGSNIAQALPMIMDFLRQTGSERNFYIYILFPFERSS
jgi:hypothetical protein